MIALGCVSCLLKHDIFSNSYCFYPRIPVFRKITHIAEFIYQIISTFNVDFFRIRPILFFKRNLPTIYHEDHSSRQPYIIRLRSVFKDLLVFINQNYFLNTSIYWSINLSHSFQRRMNIGIFRFCKMANRYIVHVPIIIYRFLHIGHFINLITNI